MHTACSTGIPLFDSEHDLLLDLYRRLAACLLGSEDVDAFVSGFQELLDYASDLFAREEEVMRERDFADYQRHRHDHMKLLETGAVLLHTARERFEKYDCYALLLFIRHWIGNHIRDHDKPLAAFLRDPKGLRTPGRASLGQPSPDLVFRA
jgi:hemerythrin-like metal-binding domain